MLKPPQCATKSASSKVLFRNRNQLRLTLSTCNGTSMLAPLAPPLDPAPIAGVAEQGLPPLAGQRQGGRDLGAARLAAPQPPQLVFHHRHITYRGQHLVAPGEWEKLGARFLIPAPSDGQIRGDGERGHAGDCHPAAEHLLHHRIAADAPRHHHGHAGGGHYLPGKLQEIGFPRQGTAITAWPCMAAPVGQRRELHQIHPEGG